MAPLYYGSRLRRRPIPAVIAEIEHNIAAHGIREFLIWADTFTADRRYVHEFCTALAVRNLGVSWSCNSRVDTVDADILATMKTAGLWMISFGIESASDEILHAAHKEITAAQSRRAVLMAKAAGLYVTGHFIFGLPGETQATMAATLAFALELRLNLLLLLAALPLVALLAVTTLPPRIHRIYYDEDIYANVAQNIAVLRKTGMCNYGTFEYGEYFAHWLQYNKEPSGWPFLVSLAFQLGGTDEALAFFLNNLIFTMAPPLVFFLVYLILLRQIIL